MNDLKIPVGISDFTKIRENGYYYTVRKQSGRSMPENMRKNLRIIMMKCCVTEFPFTRNVA